MILIKKFKKLIPSFRHKKIINIIDNQFVFYKYKKYKNYDFNKNLIKRRKLLYKPKNVLLNFNILKHTSLIIKKSFYDFKPYKRFLNCQTIHNVSYNIPGVEFLNVGKIIYHYNFFKHYQNLFFFKGFITFLYNIPFIVSFSNVTNYWNTKITYAKSSGTFCKIKKLKKTKKKLVLIILPSNNEIFLNKMCKAYIGKNTNFKTNELTEGKYGFSFHKHKNIKVRGVAMNPVDHPNGGRTKTVQPERSPWNWVAKKKK